MTQKTLHGKEAKPKIELDTRIKEAVISWRQKGYVGASEVSKRLLNFWFFEDHYDDAGRPFEFWPAQREAVEALIYVYEVCKYDSLAKLAKGFDLTRAPADSSWSTWPKYGFKMATGSGKTFVMELAIVWQYFNKVFGTNNGSRYSRHFLILAPNLIVLDRLQGSLEDSKEIRTLPFIPPEWKNDFDLQVLIQSDRIARYGTGILHLTNIQQLYERLDEPPNPVAEQLGPKPRTETDPFVSWEYLRNSLAEYDDLLVINDEAHHVHSDDLEWNKTIQKLDKLSRNRHKNGLTMQLDFSATPKDLTTGSFFPHIIYDYPLRQAIIDRKVKRPRIGKLEQVPEPPPTASFVIRNKAQIEVGVKMLREFQKELLPHGKKPVLFVICDINKNADQVGKFLTDEIGMKGKVLVIHTDTAGNITRKDLPFLREAAKKIDNNEYEVIVSVMMLKEGWDVRNVVVIVPLRALVSQVLPEQILGRGLRRMEPYNEQWDEHLIVIDHPRFEQLWRAEIASGELEADIVPLSQAKPPVRAIGVDTTKLDYDIEIPVLEGGIVRRTPDIHKLDVAKLPSRLFKLADIPIPHILYKEKDLLTSKILREEILAFDYTDDFDIFLSYMTRAVTRKAGVSTLFSELVPKVEEYIINNLFDAPINPKDREQVKRLNDPRIREKVLEVFHKELMSLSIEQKPVIIVGKVKVSESETIHTSKSEQYLYKPVKCVFNLCPADSKLEAEFMHYLDSQTQVIAFVKVVKEMVPIRILYYDQFGFVRYYVPDFLVKTDDGVYILETKGRDLDLLPNVKLKDKAAEEWCRNASEMTGTPWNYVKILSDEFQARKHLPLNEMLSSVRYVQTTIKESTE